MYLDESGIEDNATTANGWSLKGQRCYGKKLYQHKRRVSMVAGLCGRQIIAPLVFEGTCNTALFETYVKDFLIPELKPGQTVVMDNISFHKRKEIKMLIESIGADILFLKVIVRTEHPYGERLYNLDARSPRQASCV